MISYTIFFDGVVAPKSVFEDEVKFNIPSTLECLRIVNIVAVPKSNSSLSELTLLDVFADKQRTLVNSETGKSWELSLDTFWQSLHNSPSFDVKESVFVRVRNNSDSLQGFQLTFIANGLKKRVS